MESQDGTNSLDLAYSNNRFEVISYLNQKSNQTLVRNKNQVQKELKEEEHQGLRKPEEITDQEKEEAVRLKDKGNKEFKDGEYKKAIELYDQAFLSHPYNIQVLTNRAACFINTK